MRTGHTHRVLALGVSVLLNGGLLLAAGYGFKTHVPDVTPDAVIDVSIEPFTLSDTVARESEAPPPPPEPSPPAPQPPAPAAPPVSQPSIAPAVVQAQAAPAQAAGPIVANPAPPAPVVSAPSVSVPVAGPPAPTPPPAAAKTGRSHSVAYSALVRRHLESFKAYPRSAKRRREEGTATLTFVIDRQGRVLTARLAKSSGHEALDQAALEMVQAADPLPVPPPDIAGERIEMTVPAEFFLMD